MSKRILLINPPFYRLMGSHFNGLSTGLCSIGSVLASEGHFVRIFNADYENSSVYGNLKDIFDSYPNYKNLLSDFDHPIWSEIRSAIRNFSPQIVGITMLTGTYKSAENIARICKQINKDITVIVGGTHPTVMPDEVIMSPYYDYVIRGEGEFSFLELANGIDPAKVNGVTYKAGEGRIQNNPERDFIQNIDTLSLPGRDLYINPSSNFDYGYVLTARGCPFECTFCASKKIWKQTVRYRSPESIFTELQGVHEKYGTCFFYFIDDTFTLNKARAKKICSLIIENNLKIEWICDTRVDTLDFELLKLMKKSGCIRVKLGIESGSDRILKSIKKKITKQQIQNVIAMIKKVGIEITAYIMIGFPDETNEDVKETLKFAELIDAAYYSISILAPYPGTEIYEQAQKRGVSLPKEHWEYFFHTSKEMLMVTGIDEHLIEECLSLNERKGRIRK